MAHHFGRPSYPNGPAPKMILQPTIHPLTGGPLSKASPLRFVQRNPIAALDRLHDGDLAQTPRIRVNALRVISRIHQLVERPHPLCAQLHQRNGDLRIVGAGTGQDGADRDIAVNDIQVQLVTLPVFRLALRAFLAPAVAGARQVSQILGQTASRLQLQACRRGFGGLLGLLRQFISGKLRKSPTESREAGHLVRGFPTTESAQRRPGFERLDQRFSSDKLIHFFGDERMDQPDSFIGRTTNAAPVVASDKRPQWQQRDHFHEPMVFFSQFPHLLNQNREEISLQVLPDIVQSRTHADLIVKIAGIFKKSSTPGVLKSPPPILNPPTPLAPSSSIPGLSLPTASSTNSLPLASS